MFLRTKAGASMAFSAVGVTKIKNEIDDGVEADNERAVTAPSPKCSGYNPVVYGLGTRDPNQNIYLRRHFSNQTQEGPLQSQHVFLNEASRGTGRATHDFLSLYGGIPSHFVEPNPSKGASSSLTTQDLLQPLESGSSPNYQESKILLLNKPTKEETLSEHGSIVTPVADLLLPICTSSQLNPSMEVSQIQLLRLAVPDGNMQGIRCQPQMSLNASREEHFLVESMRSSDVTVEQEHVKSSKCLSNPRADHALSDRLYPPKGLNHGPLDGCYKPIPVLSRHWQTGSHPFVEVIKRPMKVPSEDEEDEVEGLDHTKEQSKESHFVQGEHASRDVKNMDARASTPRSKHSATEQRRRSKINDRFQMLRNLVPHSDQKRDKASFLLEVIEYVQMLQEKVQKYEGVEQGKHQERLNNLAWEHCKKTLAPEAFLRDTTTMDNAGFLKNITSTGLAIDVKPISETHDFIGPKVTPSASENGAPRTNFYPCVRQQSSSHINGRPALISNGIDSSHENHNCKRVIPKSCSSLLSGQHELRTIVPPPNSDSQTISCLPKRCATTCNMDELAHLSGEPMSAVNVTEQSKTQGDAEDHMLLAVERQGDWSTQFMESLPVPQKSVAPVNSLQGPSSGTFGSDEKAMHNTSCANGVVGANKEDVITNASKNISDTPTTNIRDESFAVTGGIISVSSIYSQELLGTLTRALQSSGLDLSQANISVQINLGKRGGASTAFSSDEKTIRSTPESSSQSQQSKGHARPIGLLSESDAPCKKPKVQDA